MQSTAVEASSTGPLHIDLGPAWDRQLDVIVLAGAGATPTIDHLLACGHTRIILFVPTDHWSGGDSRIRTVRSTSELWAAMISLTPAPRSVVLRRVPGGGVSSELHQDLAKTVQELAVNRATFAAKGDTWVRNSLRNMRFMVERPSIETLSQKFAKKPCVIVSAGPSLSRNIEGLRELKGRGLLRAGNSTVAPMKAAGIEPDLVIVADPIDPSNQLAGAR